MKFKATRSVRPSASLERVRGLGDAVHAVAKPVARILDTVMGTDWLNCEACAERRRKLNKAVPFGLTQKLSHAGKETDEID